MARPNPTFLGRDTWLSLSLVIILICIVGWATSIQHGNAGKVARIEVILSQMGKDLSEVKKHTEKIRQGQTDLATRVTRLEERVKSIEDK